MDLRDEAIHQARSADEVSVARELFREYADWLKVDLCFQGFERELATLPGDYVPPGGRRLIAWHHEKPVGCIALRRADASAGEVKRLYVRAEARGKMTLEFNVTQGYLRLLDEEYSTKLTTNAGKVSLAMTRRVSVTKTRER